MKKVDPLSPATERAYRKISESLAALGVEPSTMFGMPTLKREGKAIAGIFGDAMVFKLEGEGLARALGLKGAENFDPSGKGRPMKAWVEVPKAHAKQWPKLALLSYEACVGASVKKRPAKKKVPAKKTRAKKERARKGLLVDEQ